MPDVITRPVVVSVHRSAAHAFSKAASHAVQLIAGLGVEGDAHAGPHDQHVYHIRKFGKVPNLRQVHLIQTETLDELRGRGHVVRPGELGENIATRDLDLLALPTGTRLALGPEAVIELTGLRNPCVQIDRFQPGLMSQLVARTAAGVVRKCGVMSIVVRGGEVKPGDPITVTLPPLPHTPLTYVPPVPAGA
ncbi:MOSC domain-containing protein [Rhodoplanes sp. TEM]|uniref:MOSC domain-containing protein n=1 Tax=Rhodoplanes tepidamans TaxID=200616 RepID=A0ABT5J9T2_RHOTP|nr:MULTISPECIES: MOSC domain-containing protein [Rhodoplanes]MDC7786342.1 MOSC domain-containing protein [Rhodoplanes tepidamans]MDC7984699.1 MOSC domain-containing protein [Rhodoplanes sp. TEM]MDQ0354085.1 MOSC domain-containing protein YiiM [Rhodoplanes tepidamans]